MALADYDRDVWITMSNGLYLISVIPITRSRQVTITMAFVEWLAQAGYDIKQPFTPRILENEKRWFFERVSNQGQKEARWLERTQ